MANARSTHRTRLTPRAVATSSAPKEPRWTPTGSKLTGTCPTLRTTNTFHAIRPRFSACPLLRGNCSGTETRGPETRGRKRGDRASDGNAGTEHRGNCSGTAFSSLRRSSLSLDESRLGCLGGDELPRTVLQRPGTPHQALPATCVENLPRFVPSREALSLFVS